MVVLRGNIKEVTTGVVALNLFGESVHNVRDAETPRTILNIARP